MRGEKIYSNENRFRYCQSTELSGFSPEQEKKLLANRMREEARNEIPGWEQCVCVILAKAGDCMGFLSLMVTLKSSFLGTEAFLPLHLPKRCPEHHKRTVKVGLTSSASCSRPVSWCSSSSSRNFLITLLKKSKQVSTPPLLLCWLILEAKASYDCLRQQQANL